MTKEDFIKQVKELSTNHSVSFIENPEENSKAVAFSKYDFGVGMVTAYNLLNEDNIIDMNFLEEELENEIVKD